MRVARLLRRKLWTGRPSLLRPWFMWFAEDSRWREVDSNFRFPAMVNLVVVPFVPRGCSGWIGLISDDARRCYSVRNWKFESSSLQRRDGMGQAAKEMAPSSLANN